MGMTSVGSGSLIIVLLMAVYPTLTLRQLVGTDLVQAIPLVGAAAAGHLLFGHVELGLTASLLVGALPGVFLGAKCSASAPTAMIRRALVVVLPASGLKLLGVDNTVVGWVALVTVAGALITWFARAPLARWVSVEDPAVPAAE